MSNGIPLEYQTVVTARKYLSSNLANCNGILRNWNVGQYDEATMNKARGMRDACQSAIDDIDRAFAEGDAKYGSKTRTD